MVCELPWCCRTGLLTINHNWDCTGVTPPFSSLGDIVVAHSSEIPVVCWLYPSSERLFGADYRNRTDDQLVTNQLLYLLS